MVFISRYERTCSVTTCSQASRRFWVVTDSVSDLVEETPEDDRETRIVVLFGSTGPVLLEELDEKDSE
jgi:hypothetical protein